MGLAAAGTVAVAVLIAITLLPAVLGFAGHRIARVNRVLAWRPRAAARERTSEVDRERALGDVRHQAAAGRAARAASRCW